MLNENNVEESVESTKVDAESFYEQTDEVESEETTSESESEESKENSETIVDGNIESEESESKDDDGSEEEETESTESKDDGEENFEIVLPEKTHLSEELAGEFADFAKENGLTNEVAQKVFEQNSKVIDSFIGDALQKQTDLHESWRKETLSDPELGGQNSEATTIAAKKALDKYGTPELKTMLRDSKFGDNIEVVRLFNNIGKAMSNDEMVHGSGHTKTERSFEDKFYNAKK